MMGTKQKIMALYDPYDKSKQALCKVNHNAIEDIVQIDDGYGYRFVALNSDGKIVMELVNCPLRIEYSIF